MLRQIQNWRCSQVPSPGNLAAHRRRLPRLQSGTDLCVRCILPRRGDPAGLSDSHQRSTSLRVLALIIILIPVQILSGLQPYHNIPSDVMIALALARKTKPERPVSAHLTDAYWKFIQGCWCDIPENRPSAAKAHEELLSLRS